MIERQIEIITIPPVVEVHAHLRCFDPQKEGFPTGTRAALAGGVVGGIFDMPNDKSELTNNLARLERKIELARGQIYCDVGFHLGTNGNKDGDEDFPACEKYVYALKVYMNNTTGGYIVNDPDRLDGIFRRWDFPKPIIVHAEGDTLATALALAKKYGRRIHVAHVSQKEEVRLIYDAKQQRPEMVTAEVTPHHLFLNSLLSLDPNFIMKPPLGGFKDNLALQDALNEGIIDIVATDHAPHTRAEKASDNPLSGVPGLETTLPLLFRARDLGIITLKRIIEVTNTNPIKIFGLPVQPDTFVEIEKVGPWKIDGEKMQTKAKDSPFNGWVVEHGVKSVTLRGRVVYKNGEILSEPGSGRVLP